MKTFLKDSLEEGKHLLRQQAALFAVILLFSVVILFSPYVPDLWFLYFVMTALIFQIHNTRNCHLPHHMDLYGGVILGAGLYAVHLLTYSDALVFSAGCIQSLWLSLNLIVFYSSRERYVPELVNRIGQTLIASFYLAVIYGIVYLISYFINQIFVLHFLYSSLLFRSASAAAFFVFFVVLFSRKSRGEWKPGPLFRMLFGKIIPRLSMAAGTLAVVYMLQVLLGYREDFALLSHYYPFLILFYLAFAFSFSCPVKSGEQRVVTLLFIAITAVSMAFIVKREITIPAQQYSSLYALVINALFLLYNTELLVRRTAVSVRLSVVAAAAALIVFFPLLGYMGYTHFTIYQKQGENMVPQYSMEKIWNGKLQENQMEVFTHLRNTADKTAEVKRDQVYFSANQTGLEISLTPYTDMRMNAEMNSDKPYVYRDLTLVPSADRKSFDVLIRGNLVQTVPVYDMIQEGNKKDPLLIRGDEYMLIIYGYHYTKEGQTVLGYSMHFSVLTKSDD